MSYLLLAKAARDAPASFELISLLDKIVPAYAELVAKLGQAGAKAVQIDEPILVVDTDVDLKSAFQSAYKAIAAKASGVGITLTTYFGRLEKNLDFVVELPVQALHIDLDRAPEQFEQTLAAVKPTSLKLSLGLVSGRNIWKSDLAKLDGLKQKAVDALGADRVIVATSSSLRHTPVTLANETKLSAEQRDWFAFATEKVHELAALAKGDKSGLEANKKSIAARRAFEENSDKGVRERLQGVTEAMYSRKSPFAERRKAQAAVCELPLFPTTTIGSFPQTKEIRQARAKFTKGEIDQAEYDEFIKKEIEHVVRFQVRGRSCDIALTLRAGAGRPRPPRPRRARAQRHGPVLWRAAQGLRLHRERLGPVVRLALRPSADHRVRRLPSDAHDRQVVLVRSVVLQAARQGHAHRSRHHCGSILSADCVDLLQLNWSFPRVDVSREVQSRQLALALRDEVVDLEKAGIFAIQGALARRCWKAARAVDTRARVAPYCSTLTPRSRRAGDPRGPAAPPCRLGRLPDLGRRLVPPVDRRRRGQDADPLALVRPRPRSLPRTDRPSCYSDFNDIFSHIARLDADVISIEASRSDLKLLNVFTKSSYSNQIGVRAMLFVLTALTACAARRLRHPLAARALAGRDPAAHRRDAQADPGRPALHQPGLRPQDARLEGDRGLARPRRRRRQVGPRAAGHQGLSALIAVSSSLAESTSVPCVSAFHLASSTRSSCSHISSPIPRPLILIRRFNGVSVPPRRRVWPVNRCSPSTTSSLQ